MKLYVSQEVMKIFRIEMEQFGMRRICLVPGWAEGVEPKIWGMSELKEGGEPIVELKSPEMSIWVPQRCIDELEAKIVIRGRRGFVASAITGSLDVGAVVFAF